MWVCKRKRQLIEFSAQAHTEAAYGFAADMQLEQEIIKIWGRLIMEGQNLDWTEYFLPVAIICLNGPFTRYFQLSARSVTRSSLV